MFRMKAEFCYRELVEYKRGIYSRLEQLGELEKINL